MLPGLATAGPCGAQREGEQRFGLSTQSAHTSQQQQLATAARRQGEQPKQQLLPCTSRPTMPLIYSSVSRGTTTLAEYAAYSGNFSSVAKDFLDRAGKNDGKFTYSVDGHTFNFLTRGGLSECSAGGVGGGGGVVWGCSASCPPCSWLLRDLSLLFVVARIRGPPAPRRRGELAGRTCCRLQRTSWWPMKHTGGPSPRPSWTRWQPSSRPSTRTRPRRPRSSACHRHTGEAGHACCGAGVGRARRRPGRRVALCRVSRPHRGAHPHALCARALTASRRKQLKQMMEHATQFPEEYSKVANVQRKVRRHASWHRAVHAQGVLG